jgi:FkbM family methyltransferase
MLFNINGINMVDELAYLVDLSAGALSRRILGLKVLPGFFILKDVTVRIKDRENSLFLCRAGTDEICHVIPNFEPKTWEFIKSITTRGDVIIDVGANIGTYTVPLARKVGMDGLVVALEPSPVCKTLSFNVAINGLENVVVINKAAYSKRKIMNLYYTPQKTGLTSLYSDWTAKASTHKCSIEVEVLPLDELLRSLELKKVRLLKIDVEGAEKDVLQGARNILEITDFCVFEARPNTIKDCKKILMEEGFKKITILEQWSDLANYVATKG